MHFQRFPNLPRTRHQQWSNKGCLIGWSERFDKSGLQNEGYNYSGCDHEVVVEPGDETVFRAE